jgi:hypothetical protein
MPYGLKKDFTIKVGPDYNITPTLRLKNSYHHSSSLMSYLTESVSYDKSDNLIAFFHMPVTGAARHGALCNSVSGSTHKNTCSTSKSDVSGHVYNGSTFLQTNIPSASKDTPFYSTDDYIEDKIDETQRVRPKNIRSICFSPELEHTVQMGGGAWWASQITGSQQITFAAWIKPESDDSTTGGYRRLFEIGDSNPFTTLWWYDDTNHSSHRNLVFQTD